MQGQLFNVINVPAKPGKLIISCPPLYKQIPHNFHLKAANFYFGKPDNFLYSPFLNLAIFNPNVPQLKRFLDSVL